MKRISSEPFDEISEHLGLMVESLQKLISLSDRDEYEVVSDFNVSFQFSTRPKRDIEKLSVFRIMLPIKSLRYI